MNPIDHDHVRIAAEEDAALVSTTSTSLVPRADEVVRRVGPRARVLLGAAPSQVTCSSDLHDSVEDVVSELARCRAMVCDAAAGLARPAALVSHPHAPRCDRDRLRAPVSLLRIRVAVGDRRRLLGIHNRLREHLPILVALGAAAPFEASADAGVASVRRATRGVPPDLRSWAQVEQDAAWAHAAHDVLGDRQAAWDLRLDPATSSVELTAIDLQPTTAATRPLVALVAALARSAEPVDDQVEQAEPLVPAWRVEENLVAARGAGMTGHLADPRTGQVLSTRTLAELLLASLEPWADPALFSAAALVERNAAVTLREVGVDQVVDWLCSVYA